MNTKPVIVNIHKEGVFKKTNTESCVVCDVPVAYAESARQWSCGIQITSLNIFCELNPSVTLYLMSRLRSPNAHPIITASTLGIIGKNGAILFNQQMSSQEISEWIEDAYGQ